MIFVTFVIKIDNHVINLQMVCDHCHFTGRYHEAAHQECNIVYNFSCKNSCYDL